MWVKCSRVEIVNRRNARMLVDPMPMCRSKLTDVCNSEYSMLKFTKRQLSTAHQVIRANAAGGRGKQSEIGNGKEPS